MRPSTPLRLAALPLLASLLTGCSQLVVLNPAGDVAAQQKNRRVEIVIRPKK